MTDINLDQAFNKILDRNPGAFATPAAAPMPANQETGSSEMDFNNTLVIERPDNFSQSASGPEGAAAAVAEGEEDAPEVLDFSRTVKVESFLLPPAPAHSSVAEEYRNLRLRLQGLKVERSSAMFTSCFRGEGKTATAVQAALAMARRRDQKVLLLDLNLRYPGLEKLLGITPQWTIADVLEGQCAPEEALVYSEGDNLYALTCAIADDVSEVLEDRALPILLEKFHQAFDFIIVDTPSCLVTADPLMLGRYFGGAVMVVQAHETRREDVANALRALEEQSIPRLGIVLTFVKNFVPRIFQRG